VVYQPTMTFVLILMAILIGVTISLLNCKFNKLVKEVNRRDTVMWKLVHWIVSWKKQV